MKSLSDYTQKQMTEIYESNGAFFAFSTEQFNESKKEGVEYVNCPWGLIAPKENAKKLMEGIDKIFENGKAQLLAENSKEDIIRYELWNHEAFYTYDLESTFDSVKCYGFTMQDVKTVFDHIRSAEDTDC